MVLNNLNWIGDKGGRLLISWVNCFVILKCDKDMNLVICMYIFMLLFIDVNIYVSSCFILFFWMLFIKWSKNE